MKGFAIFLIVKEIMLFGKKKEKYCDKNDALRAKITLDFFCKKPLYENKHGVCENKQGVPLLSGKISMNICS